jgi:hypothetical protein
MLRQLVRFENETIQAGGYPVEGVITDEYGAAAAFGIDDFERRRFGRHEQNRCLCIRFFIQQDGPFTSSVQILKHLSALGPKT